VKMATSAQAINVLQALILTDEEKMVLTPTYHAFEMYRVHHDATMIPLELHAPCYGADAEALPSLHASASRDARGALHVSIVNLDPQRSAQLELRLAGRVVEAVSGRVLTASAVNALNDFASSPVRPTTLSGAQVTAQGVSATLPSKSVTVLTLE
jgi:alpha-L-arabinofuranosidase